MKPLSQESLHLLERNGISPVPTDNSDSSDAIKGLINLIFQSIKALRELNESEYQSSAMDMGRMVLSNLTGSASALVREMVNETIDTDPLSCPAHGHMELISFGSGRHAHLLDSVFKVRNQKKILCRTCSRGSLGSDLKFYYCPSCHYVRCIFCNPPPNIAWEPIQALLEACPSSIGKIFPGGRLLLHEIAARDWETTALRTCLRVYTSGCMMSDQDGELPLHWACTSGSSLSAVEALVSAYPESVRLANQEGKLPLHMAVERRSTEVALFLADKYLEGCSKSDGLGWIPLHYAVNSQPEPVPELLRRLLDAYPKGAEQPTNQGFFPLHLYVRNRTSPAIWVLRLLLEKFPFAAFVTTGDQDELPLHVVASRDPPSPEAVAVLVDINPEGCLQSSAQTAWSDAATPLSIALSLATGKNRGMGQVATREEEYWQVVRLMLLPNRRHDRDTLQHSNWMVRRWVLLYSLRLFKTCQSETKSQSPLSSQALCKINTDPGTVAFLFLAESYGSCYPAWRSIIQYL